MHHPESILRAPLSLLLVCLLAAPGRARASLFGEENGPLTALVVQAVMAFEQGAQSLAELRQTYEETKKYVGLAQDAVKGFNDFANFASGVVNDPTNALASVMPDAAYLVRDIQSPQNWGRGTGELQRLVRVCLAGNGECGQFREAVTAQAARDAISKTFGTAPVPNDAIETVDTEAAVAIRGSMASDAKATMAAEQAKALMRKCTSGTSNEAMQACQSAANLGQLLQVEQTALMNQQLAESNRLKAVELAAQNADKKQAVIETFERAKMLDEGLRRMTPKPYLFEEPNAAAPEGRR